MSENDLKELKILGGLKKVLPKSFLEAFPSLLGIWFLLILFFVFNFWYRMLTEVKPDVFQEALLITSSTQFFNGGLWLLIPALAIIVLMVWRRKLLLIKWTEIEGGKKLQLIVGVCVAVLTWAHITYPLDYFFDEHILERLVIFVLALLIIWRPFFLIIYLFYPIIFHFGEPLMVNHWSIAELPMRILILFGSQLVLWLICSKYRWKISSFVFLMLCIVAGNYFPAGYGKIIAGWLYDNQIYLLLSNMYADGWVNFLSQETLSEVTHFLSKYNLFLKIGGLIVEFGCILILIRKNRSVRFFLIGFLLFHVLVFIMTGILFLFWMILELVLLSVLWKKNVITTTINNFTGWHILVSFCLVFTAIKWLQPSVYVWNDSPVNYTYQFEVEDTSGQISELPSQYFWPKYYEFAWTNDFHFLHENPTLYIIWGVSFSEEEVKALLSYTNNEEILAYEKKKGKNRFKPELAKEFERYMKDFVREKKYKLTMNPLFRAISAPPQRLVFPVENMYDGENDIVKINVYQKLSFFDGEHYEEVRTLKVLTIDCTE